jgi:hypothetical protein
MLDDAGMAVDTRTKKRNCWSSQCNNGNDNFAYMLILDQPGSKKQGKYFVQTFMMLACGVAGIAYIEAQESSASPEGMGAILAQVTYKCTTIWKQKEKTQRVLERVQLFDAGDAQVRLNTSQQA